MSLQANVMVDPQHIVERIRAFVASTDETRTPELDEIAEAYASLCRDANARLRRCRDYLRRGLRAEAIHEADEAPPLLDVAALLDIPETKEWVHSCAVYDLTRPPPLLIEAAQELNEAYAADQPLRTLLERHRRLALQRAPLVQRLAVLRELAETDSVTPFWVEDIETFETARLRELAVDAATAAQAGDRAAVARLREEITSGAWRAPVPRELQQLLERTDAAWRQEDGERQLRDLLPELDTAYGAMDFDGATQLLRRVKQLTDFALLEVPDDLVARITPVSDWASAERHRREKLARFEAACAQLSLAVQADAPEFELERLKREALSLGDELPPEVARKLRQHAEHREAKRAARVRRRRLIVAGIVLACCVGVAVIVRATLRDRHAREAYLALSSLVGKEKWDEAAQAWDRLPETAPGATDRSDFQLLRRQIDDALAQAQTRHAAFSDRMKAAMARGPDAPDNAALAEAESLARTEAEKTELAEFKSKVEAAQRSTRERLAATARERLAALTVETETLEKDAKAGTISVTSAALATTESALAALTNSPQLPPEIKRDTNALVRRLKVMRDALTRTATERDAMDAVVRGSASPSTLRDALLAYGQQLPESPHVAGFKQTAGDAPAWEAIEEAARLIDSWEAKPQPPLAQIAARVHAIAAYVGKYADSPLRPTFDDWQSYLMQEQRALANDGPWKGELNTLLASPILKEFKSIRTVDGKVYYLLPDTPVQSDSLGIGFNAVLSGDTSTTKRITLKPAQISRGLTDSPQAVLVRDLLKRLVELNDTNWETFGLDVIDAILSHKDVDPVLRVILLGRCAKLAQASTWGAGDALKALEATTTALNAGDIAWMNPNDGPANQAREKASAILANLSPLKELRAAITARREAVLKSLRFKIVGHAVLLREGEAWTAVSPVKPGDGLQAWVVMTENGHKRLQRIGGTTGDGRVAIDAEAVRGVGDGAMIFLVTGP